MIYQDKQTMKKVLWTIMVVAVSIILQHIPVWGIQTDILKKLFVSGTPLTFTDTLTGGALSQLSIGGFGVTSLIMAGIILQLVSIVYPKLEKLQSDGEHGRIVFERVTFILAMAMTFIIGVLIVFLGNGRYYQASGILKVVPLIEWLIGTGVIVKLSQSVHFNGIGNGATLILAANIASRVPSDIVTRIFYGQTMKMWMIAGIMLFIVIILAIYLQSGVIHVRIQQTRKTLSMMNAEGTVPIPMVAASVLPVIYAQSIMAIPTLISMLSGKTDGFLGEILIFTSQTHWYAPTSWKHITGLCIYILLIIAICNFASRMSFSSAEVANRMRERADVLPGVTPGKATECYLEKRRRKLSAGSAIMLVLIAVIPDLILAQLGIAGFSFMGTSLIILMAAFWDLRLRLTGRLKHLNKKYVLFRKEQYHGIIK